MLGWISNMFKSQKEPPEETEKRSQVVHERVTKAERAIERSDRLMRASGYYNDRLEGTRNHGRTS